MTGDVIWNDETGRAAVVLSRGAEASRVPAGIDAYRRITTGQGRRGDEAAWSGIAWEPERRTLHGVRDPLGEIPLFYASTEARAAIGATPDAVVEALGIHPTPNLRRLGAFCLGTNDAESDEFLREVRRVRPGEAVAIGPASTQTRSWWQSADPRDDSSSQSSSKSDQADSDDLATLERLIIQALEPVTGRVTIALSGGVDSSLIATFLALRSDLDVHAIHLGSDAYPSADETELARELAHLLGFSFERVSIDEIGLGHQVDPAGPSPFASTPLDQALRRHAVGTLITGIGGDQLFSADRQLGLKSMTRNVELVELARQADLRRREDWRAALVGAMERSELFRELRKWRPDSDEPTAVERREPWMKPRTWMKADRSGASDAPLHLTWGWEDVVRNTAHADGITGVHSHHPFLNPEIWAWAARLPNHVRFRRGQNKWLLRELLKRRLPSSLGNEVADRPKSQTFNAWAASRLAHYPHDFLDPTLTEMIARALVRPITFQNRYSAFRRVVREQREDLVRIHSIALWRTLVAEQWLTRLNSDV